MGGGGIFISKGQHFLCHHIRIWGQDELGYSSKKYKAHFITVLQKARRFELKIIKKAPGEDYACKGVKHQFLPLCTYMMKKNLLGCYYVWVIVRVQVTLCISQSNSLVTETSHPFKNLKNKFVMSYIFLQFSLLWRMPLLHLHIQDKLIKTCVSLDTV